MGMYGSVFRILYQDDLYQMFGSLSVRDLKHISQSQEYEDTTNVNELSGGVGKRD